MPQPPRPHLLLRVPTSAAWPTSTELPEQALPYWPKMFATRDKQRSVILSDSLLSLRAHYAHRTTIPCTKEVAGICEYCPRLRRMYLAFLAVWDGAARATKIACLTEGAVRGCEGLDKRQDLAGRELTLWRTGKSDKGPVRCQISADVRSPIDPSKRIDHGFLRRVLFNIWGITLCPVEGPVPHAQTEVLFDDQGNS